jgi:hypothetical protein
MKVYGIYLTGLIKYSYAWLILLSSLANSQTFPPPRNLVGAFPGPETILKWDSPSGDSASHYNLYRNGLFNGQFLLFDYTTDTQYQYIPYFKYEVHHVTAVYENPDGESIPTDPVIMLTSPLSLPFNATFEEVGSAIYNSSIKGSNSWVKVDTASFEGQCCAILPSFGLGDICELYWDFWSTANLSHINLDFWAKVPSTYNKSDTLIIMVDQNKIIDSIHSVNQWTHFSYSIIDSSNYSIGISLRGISQEGGGIFVDNIDIQRKTVGFSEYHSYLNGVVVFPNPAKEYIFIKTLVPINSDLNISIIDINSRIRYSQRLNGLSKHHKLDLRSLSEGIYIIKIQYSERIVYQKLIIEKEGM